MKNNLMKFAGMLTDEEAEKIKKEIYAERKLPSRRFKIKKAKQKQN